MKILQDKYEDETTKNLTEMARVGFTDDDYEIYVNTNDSGKIPHFHYRDSTDWNSFHTCIKMRSSEYFHHGNKQNILNNKQRKILVEFLSSVTVIKNFNGLTNWQVMLSLWNMNNSDVTIDENFEMPNYLLL